MSLKNHVQEFQFPEPSENRKKIDRFLPNESVNPRYMENAAIVLGKKEEESLQSESTCNIRKSLAWDSAFFTSPGVLDPEELFGTMNFRDMESGVGIPELWEQPSESLQQEITSRITECSIRRSLAWDNAFFTSAGVLDPEELSLVNKGFQKSEAHQLPRIKEDFWRSAESNSTEHSGDFSLASLEIDLFDDRRASLRKNSKASNVATLNSKLGRVAGMQNVHSSKKLDASSQIRMKPMPASRRQTMNTYGSERITKEGSVAPRAQASQSGDTNPLSAHKPPKILRRVSPLATAPTKRASLGPNHVKMESKASKSALGQQMTVSKKPGLEDSCSVIPTFTRSPKSPSSGLCSVNNESVGFDYTPSDSSRKCPPNSLRRKIDSRLAASASGTPLRKLARNRSELVNLSHSTYLLSTPKFSCTSPASSIDGWSSESSTYMNQRSHNSTVSLDVTPCRGVSFDSEASQASDSESHLTKVKPSGLRMPSPKIGFFDTENTSALSPNGGLKFHSGVENSSRIGSGISKFNGAANRTRHVKLRSSGTSMKTGNVKLGSQRAGDPCPPLGIHAQVEEEQNASPGASIFSGTIKGCHGTNFKAQNDLSCGLSSRGCSETVGLGSKSKAEDKGTKGFMKKKIGRTSEEQVFPRAKKQSLKKHEVVSQHCPENNRYILHEHGKENMYGFKNQVDCLSRHIEAIDLGRDLVIEL